MNIAVFIRQKMGHFIPAGLRSSILKHFSLLDKRTIWWESKDPYRNDPPYSTYESPYPVKLGIVKEFWHRHINYIAACREMKVAYELIDITADDWLEQFKKSDCDAFLVMPSVQMSQWKTLFDERLRVITQQLNKKIFPGNEELWMYESKRRMAYWLDATDFPHAKSFVFYNKKDALDFAERCDLPIVAKTNMGARASGVQIFRERSKIRKYIFKAFGNGIIHGDGDSHDPDWGYVLFQEFISCKYEWRIINIGPYYMGNQKLKVGDFCSGSELVGWVKPPEEVLSLVRNIKLKGNFKTADVDILTGTDGHYYVNEIQAVFGSFRPYQMLVNGKPGYFIYENNQWVFKECICCQNASSNLRVAALLEELGCKVILPSLPDSAVDEKERQESIAASK